MVTFIVHYGHNFNGIQTLAEVDSLSQRPTRNTVTSFSTEEASTWRENLPLSFSLKQLKSKDYIYNFIHRKGSCLVQCVGYNIKPSREQAIYPLVLQPCLSQSMLITLEILEDQCSLRYENREVRFKASILVFNLSSCKRPDTQGPCAGPRTLPYSSWNF